MENVCIGCGQLTWPREMPREQILAEIAQAGYDGAPASAGQGKPAALTALYARYGLKPAPGYLGVNFWDPAEEQAILARAGDLATYMHAVGCTELYVAAGGFGGYTTPRGLTRAQIAGCVRIGLAIG